MLSIFDSRTTLLASEHAVLLMDWVKKRIAKKRIALTTKEKLISDLPAILSGTTDVLIRLSKEYNLMFPKKWRIRNGKIRFVVDSRLEYIFNYSEFRKKFGFVLADKLDVSCCPYCNRNFTSTLETVKENGVDKKLVFPEFDHFYPRNLHPILALSFYNLIPSCNVCNSHYKSGKDPISKNLFHPYTEVKQNHLRFKFYPNNYQSLIGKDHSIKLDFDFSELSDINESLKNSLVFFDIKNIYERCHGGLIKDIIDKRIAYTDKYLDELSKTYKLDFVESYKILFEAFYDEKDLHKRPFSKLKKDIYNDLEIAKFLK